MFRSWPFSFASAVTLCVLASGCATPPQRIAETASGRPEVFVNVRDAELVKGLAISEFQVNGFVLTNSAPYTLQFDRQLSIGQEILAQLFIGNQYSTTPIAHVTLSFASEARTIRVFASSSISTQMAFGQIRTLSMDNNNAWFNDIYRLLQSVKSKAQEQQDIDKMTDTPPVVAQTIIGQTATTAQAAPSHKPKTVPPTPQHKISEVSDPYGVKFEEAYEGLRVVSVTPNGAANRAGVKIGHIVTHLNGRPLSALYWTNAVEQINNSAPDIVLTIQRKGDIQITADLPVATQSAN